MRDFLKNEKGSVLVIVAAGLIMLMGFMALTTDVGMLVLEKSRMQNAVDAAALAGAQELPNRLAEAESIAREYVNVKNASGGVIDNIHFPNSRKITVEASKEVPFIFAKILGIPQGKVEVTASAIKSISSGIEGLRPYGVFSDEVDLNHPDIVLMVGSWNNESGNFGAVALAHVPGGNTTGANVFEDNIATGSGETYYIGDHIFTEPGNMAGPEIAGLFATIFGEEGSWVDYSEGMEDQYPHRVIVVPVIELMDGTEIHGRTEVEIVGFAAIFVEGYTNEIDEDEDEDESLTIEELLDSLQNKDLQDLADRLEVEFENNYSPDDIREAIKDNCSDSDIRNAYNDLFGSGSNAGGGKGHLVLNGRFLEILEGFASSPSEESYGVEAVKLVE